MQLAVLGGSALLGGGSFFMKAAILGASVAGSMLMNGRKKPVGKLNDLRVSSASYGRGIPKLWGTMRVTGNMFWSTEFREEKVYISSKGKPKSSGKGQKMEKKGKAQPVYKYYAYFAMGLCEGPVDEVLRIWADNNLIYNKYNPDDDDLVGPGFTTQDDDRTGKSSQRSAGGKKGNGGHSGRFMYRFYDGSEEQMPDPYMVGKEGAENVPAYRGLSYLMFDNFALEDFGNRIPTITAEIASKSQSKALVLRMENDPNPPPNGDWYYPTHLDGPYVLDIQREMLYVGAAVRTPGNPIRRIMRVYDTAKRKEVDRIDFWDHLPQTCPHGDEGSKMGFTRTWNKSDASMFDVQGVTPNGDLIIYRMEGNLGTLIFFDPFSKKIIKSWGAAGNILTTPWEGIMTQWGVLQVIGMKSKGITQPPSPVALTAVYQRSGSVHIFDETYSKVGYIDSTEWIDNYFIGTPGTKQALYGVSSNWGGTNQYRVYTSHLDLPSSAVDPLLTHDKFLGKWPEVAGSKGNTLVLNYSSFVVGANCVGLVITSYSHGVFAVKMNPINGKILWEQQIIVDGGSGSIPFFNTFRHPSSYNNTNYTTFYTPSNLIKIDWRQETITTEPASNDVSIPHMPNPKYYWSERDATVTSIKEEGLVTYQPAIVYHDRKVQTSVSIAQICEEVAEAVGIPIEQVVTTGLETQEPLNGYMYEQPTEARAVLEELANCYQFDAVESDYKLIFKMRGGDSILTVPYDKLGIVEADFGTDNERIVETIQHHAELPERVTISYFNPKQDYENGTQYFKRPSLPVPVVHTHEHVEVTFNMALLNKYAKRMAKRILYSAWSERTTVEFKLPRDYIALDPSDTITLQLEDRAIEVRITDITTGADMMLECSGVYNYPDSYKQTADTDTPGGVVKQDSAGVIDARPMIFNIPYMVDSDQEYNGIGYYWAAGARKVGFNYGILQTESEGSWHLEGFTQLDAIWGLLDTTVPPPPIWNVEDNTTKIKLIPAFKFNDPEVVHVWETISEAEWPSERNTIIIGDEIILFKDVVENPDGTVVISRLIRGHRGSIEAAYKHNVTDTWALSHDGTIISATEDSGYLNVEQTYMINTGVPFANLGSTRRFTLDGSTDKPLPVGDVRRVNNIDGSVNFKWSRASRLGGALKNGTGTVPLSEESEQYLFYVTSTPYDPKTWNPDDPSKYIFKSATLTAADITINSAGLASIGLTNKMDIHIVIHQMSSKVGYGYPHGLTKYYTFYT